MNKIEQKIVGYKVIQPSEAKETEVILDGTEKIDLTQTKRNEAIDVESLQKLKLKRPLVCTSKTYRLKPPQAEHALYVTISSIEQDGKRYPFELFFNTKNPNHIEWTSALTLTISIAFRTAIETGSSLSGLIENLKETFGTSGSYLSKIPSKPKFVNGLVAEIGLVIEEFNNECLSWNYSGSSQEPLIFSTTEATRQSLKDWVEATTKVTNPCPACGSQLVKLDGCDTCPACAYSKCG